jgi:hypothetical protein
MIISLAISFIFALSRIEKEVPSYKFKNHASKRPKICTYIVVDAKHHFGASILTSLDLMSEVVVCPATITQITDLQLDILSGKRSSLMHIFFQFLSLLLLLVDVFLLTLEVALNLAWEIPLENVLPLSI